MLMQAGSSRSFLIDTQMEEALNETTIPSAGGLISFPSQSHHMQTQNYSCLLACGHGSACAWSSADGPKTNIKLLGSACTGGRSDIKCIQEALRAARDPVVRFSVFRMKKCAKRLNLELIYVCSDCLCLPQFLRLKTKSAVSTDVIENSSNQIIAALRFGKQCVNPWEWRMNLFLLAKPRVELATHVRKIWACAANFARGGV